MQANAVTSKLILYLGRAILAVLLGATAGFFISGYWLVDFLPPDSKLLLFLTILMVAGATAGYHKVFWHVWGRLAPLGWARKIATVLVSAALGGFLLYAGTSQWLTGNRHIGFLLPQHEFRLTALDAPEGAKLVWLSTAIGDVSYDSIAVEGWSRRGDVMVLEVPAANSLEWSTVAGDRLQLVMETDQARGELQLVADGREQVIPLANRKTRYELLLEIPWYASHQLVMGFGLLNVIVLSLALLVATGGPFQDWMGEWKKVARQPSSPSARVDLLVPGLAMLLALLLRVFNLGGVFPAVDEYYHLIAADQILNGMPLDSVYPRGLWVVTLPIALALRLFGHEVWAARAMSVFFNVLAIVPLYLLTRKISRSVAVVACLLYASSPWIVTFGRVAREYAYYPFYFYWIVYAMAQLVEAVPNHFVVRDHWRDLLKPRILLLGGLLVLPPLFGLSVDWLSTFRTILIAYLVLGGLLLVRFDWSAKENWPWLAAAALLLAVGARAGYAEQITKLNVIPRINPVPLQYFFPNPQQQWYFDRIGVVMAAAVALALTVSVKRRSTNFVPLLFSGLLLSYLAVFALISRLFFHTRHLVSTQFWYVVVGAMGLCWLFELLKRVLPWKGRAAQVLIAGAIGLSTLNPSQILLPSTSTDPDMPISEDYMHDMTEVQAALRSEVQEGDILIATVYGLYATWEGKPKFREQFRITSNTTQEELLQIVEQHASGWIVFDEIRLDLSSLSVRAITSMPQMEYIGLFGDEHVWRWDRATPH